VGSLTSHNLIGLHGLLRGELFLISSGWTTAATDLRRPTLSGDAEKPQKNKHFWNTQLGAFP
jgi:hypothetical protein